MEKKKYFEIKQLKMYIHHKNIHSNSLNNIQGLVSIWTIGDGSCFFHAALMGISTNYRNEGYFGRIKLARKLRNALAEILDEEYDNLSNGKLGDFAKNYDNASLESMKKELRSSIPVDYKYHELVSNELNIDIYILEKKHDRVYKFGRTTLYYKGRDSIILYYDEDGCHFELLGIKNGDEIKTMFKTKDSIIELIKTHI